MIVAYKYFFDNLPSLLFWDNFASSKIFFHLYLALHFIAETLKKLRKAMISRKKVIWKAIVLYL